MIDLGREGSQQVQSLGAMVVTTAGKYLKPALMKLGGRRLTTVLYGAYLAQVRSYVQQEVRSAKGMSEK